MVFIANFESTAANGVIPKFPNSTIPEVKCQKISCPVSHEMHQIPENKWSEYQYNKMFQFIDNKRLIFPHNFLQHVIMSYFPMSQLPVSIFPPVNLYSIIICLIGFGLFFKK